MKKEYIQFSKRVAVFISIFWAAYRVLTITLVFLRPDAGAALAAMLSGADDVMMVSIGFYTGNSVIEKGIVGYFNAKAQKEAKEDKTESFLWTPPTSLESFSW